MVTIAEYYASVPKSQSHDLKLDAHCELLLPVTAKGPQRNADRDFAWQGGSWPKGVEKLEQSLA